MTMAYTVAVKNARAQALANQIDASSSAGSLTIFTGVAPVGVGAITTQTALVAMPLQKPCSATISNGVLTLANITEQMVQTTGQAAWARLKNGDGVAIADMSVGLAGSGADIELPTISLIQGSYVRITAGQISEA